VPVDATISRNARDADAPPDLPEIGIFIPDRCELGSHLRESLELRAQYPDDHQPIDPMQN
jgi:hypothetical protein